jgi:hypothetical protein
MIAAKVLQRRSKRADARLVAIIGGRAAREVPQCVRGSRGVLLAAINRVGPPNVGNPLPLAHLMDVYGVVGSQWEELLEITRLASKKGWWRVRAVPGGCSRSSPA